MITAIIWGWLFLAAAASFLGHDKSYIMFSIAMSAMWSATREIVNEIRKSNALEEAE